MADLAKVKSSERILEIKHPATGENYGVQVTLMSLDDERMKTLKRQIQDRKNKQEMRQQKPLSAEEVEENGYKIAFTAITNWSWGKDPDGEENTFNGKKPDLTLANAKEIFAALPWFLHQINEAFGDEKGFFVN